MTSQPFKDWDLDFRKGVEGENLVAKLVTGKTVEVKSDRITYKTQRVAVEYAYRNKPSGIAATKAEWWAYVLLDETGRPAGVLFVETQRLKRVARIAYREGKVVAGGDDGDSDMVLVPLWALLPGRA
jgi:hypothetical protein